MPVIRQNFPVQLGTEWWLMMVHWQEESYGPLFVYVNSENFCS